MPIQSPEEGENLEFFDKKELPTLIVIA